MVAAKERCKNHFPDDLASSETADLFMSVITYRLKGKGHQQLFCRMDFYSVLTVKSCRKRKNVV